MSNPDPELIASEIRVNGGGLFIGAGLSMGAGLPSWRKLIETLTCDLKCKADHDFLTLAQAYSSFPGRQRLVDRIQQLTDTTTVRLTEVHKLLLPLGMNTWVTTNYDDLLERTLQSEGWQYDLVVDDRDLGQLKNGHIHLIKLHGDRERSDSIVLSKNDYYQARQKRERIWRHLEVELITKTFLYLGYGMNDPDFDQVQAQLMFDFDEGRKNSYALMFGCNEIKRVDCASRKIHIVNLEARSDSEKTGVLAVFLRELSSKLNYPATPRLRVGSSAASALPQDQRNQKEELEGRGYCLVAVTERLRYSGVFDKGQFSPVSPTRSWKESVMHEYPEPKYSCEFYDRSEHEGTESEIWDCCAVYEKSA